MSIRVDIERQVGTFSLHTAFSVGNETLGILGASGSGKSMTLRCIAGVDRPRRGLVELDGVPLYDSARRISLSPQRRRVGLMFQHYALFPQMTVRQNIRCGVKRLPRGERPSAVEDALEAFGLGELADRLPSQLSGGQQQRVALARMMASGPRLIMLDEPFSALDSHLRFRMEQEVASLIRRFGRTVILVSHDRDVVYRMASRVAIMHCGRIERIGTREEVFGDPGTRAACILTGCKNVSAIRRLDSCHAEALDWGIPLTLPLRPDTEALGLRMHAVCPGEGQNAFRCRVREVVENPFSFTVMLHPICAPDNAAAIGWEMEKAMWKSLRAEEMTVHFPENSLLQLRG